MGYYEYGDSFLMILYKNLILIKRFLYLNAEVFSKYSVASYDIKFYTLILWSWAVDFSQVWIICKYIISDY